MLLANSVGDNYYNYYNTQQGIWILHSSLFTLHLENTPLTPNDNTIIVCGSQLLCFLTMQMNHYAPRRFVAGCLCL